MKGLAVWLVDWNGRSELADRLERILRSNGAGSEFDLRRVVAKGPDWGAGLDRANAPDAVIITAGEGEIAALASALETLRGRFAAVPKLAVVPSAQLSGRADQLLAGFDDYLLEPLEPARVCFRLRQCLQRGRPASPRADALNGAAALTGLVGQSPAHLHCLHQIRLAAAYDVTVLICGETGTGKELAARAIHDLSRRREHLFRPLNCASLSLELAESQLFGHLAGSFTGATAPARGLIKATEGGTILLDEIQSLVQPVQPKLLRFLEDQQFRALGSEILQKADVRLLASSNIDLEAEVRAGRFREDLFYRLNVFPITLPPLRDRRDDIPLLAQHFLELFVRKHHRLASKFTTEALEKLILCDWPGNVRQLRHKVEVAVLRSQGTIIGADCLGLGNAQAPAQDSHFEPLETVLDETTKKYASELLAACGGNETEAARIAGKSRTTFWRLVQKFHLRPNP